MDNFDISAALSRGGKSDELVPLAVAKYKDNISGNSSKASNLSFDIDIRQSNVDSISVTIKVSNRILLQKALPSSYTKMGKNTWEWDGFDNLGLYDSMLLKDNTISIIFEAKKAGESKIASISIKAKPVKQDWVDVVINKSNKTVNINLRLNIKDGGARGADEPPPKEVQKTKAYKALPNGDQRKQKHVRKRNFTALEQLVFSGIRKYWSRSITTNDGNTYSLSVSPVNSQKLAMDDIAVIYNTNGDWLRSSNPGSVKSPLSFFGNLVGEKIAYNIGWLEYSNGWGYERALDADRKFSETAAHEIGHEILGSYGGDTYSYGHKGSSTVISQTKKKTTKGGSAYPTSGEIDLMKYYNGNKPKNYYSRVKASDIDVQSLLWLSRLKFYD